MSFDPSTLIKPILEQAAFAIELFGIFLIVYSVILTAVYTVRAEMKGPRQAEHHLHEVRFQFTARILTALDFLIAADIIKTTISPNPQSLLIIGATIAIRTVLTLLLRKEQESQREKEKHQQGQHK